MEAAAQTKGQISFATARPLADAVSPPNGANNAGACQIPQMQARLSAAREY